MLASPRFRLSPRTSILIGSAGVAFAIAVGCGGGSDTSTGSFGGNGSGASSNTGTNTGQGGKGGDLFMFTSSSSSGSTTGTNSGGTGGTNTGSTSTTTTTGPVCDGNPTTGPGKWAVKNTDDNGGQYGLAITADPFGNVYATGSYTGNFTIAGKTAEKTNATNPAMFVTKLDANGSAQWVHGYGSTQVGNGIPLVVGRAIAADAQGNVFVLGDMTGTSTIGSPGLQSTGGFFGDSFLVKYDTTGSMLFNKRIGEMPTGNSNGPFGTQAMRSIALHKVGAGVDVLVGGDSQGTLAFDNGTNLVASTTASAAAFIAVYDGLNGKAKLALAFGDGTTDQSVYGVAWAPTGEMIVTGKAQGTINFPGGTSLTATGTQAAFVAKIGANGMTTTWAKLYGAGTAIGKSVAVDTAGNIFVTGDHKGDIDFGGGVLSNPFGDNVFVAKLDGAGNHVWSHTYGDSTGQQVLGIAVDAMGRTVIAGEYSGKMDFGGGELAAAGQDGFLAKLDTHGCQVWAKTIGDGKLQGAKGVTFDAMGNVLVTGLLNGSATFGAATLTAPAGDALGDVFFASFGP